MNCNCHPDCKKFYFSLPVFFLLVICPGLTSGADAIPNPLTLSQALSYADKPHPDLDLVNAEGLLAEAEYEKASARYGLSVDANVIPRLSDPLAGEDAKDGFVNDSYAQLVFTRRLYDFGRTSALEKAAQEKINNYKIQVLDVKQKRRLLIMQRFFNVILSDLRYAVENENMSQLYVQFDKARERHKLGQLSDLDVKKLEHLYQQALIKRKASELRQSSSRGLLGLALNQPGVYPAELTMPDLTQIINRPFPDFEKLESRIFKTSPVFLSAQKELEQASLRLQAARAIRYPVLSAQAKASKYEREIGSNNAGEIGLTLNIPLYQGGADRAAIMMEQGHVQKARAKLEKTRLEMYLVLSDLSQRLEQLKTDYKAARIQLEYRDLQVDLNQGLYEMEVQTTLGESMAQVAKAKWQVKKTEIDYALVWAEIDALQGNLTNNSFYGEGK